MSGRQSGASGFVSTGTVLRDSSTRLSTFRIGARYEKDSWRCTRTTAGTLKVDSLLSHWTDRNHDRVRALRSPIAIGVSIIPTEDLFVWSAMGTSAW